MTDAHANFSYSTVATAPSPASSGTSLVVAAGQGALFPAVPFNATVCPAGTQPTTANAEIVRVTARTTDTLTITRAQESSAARTVIVGDQIAATITAKTLTDAEERTYDAIVDDLATNAGKGNVYATLEAARAAGAVTVLYRHSTDTGTVTVANTDPLTRLTFVDPNIIFPANLVWAKVLGLIEYLRVDTTNIEMRGDQSVIFGAVLTGTGTLTITGNDVLVVSPHVIGVTGTPITIDSTAGNAGGADTNGLTAHRPRITAGAFLSNSGPNVIRVVCAGTNTLATQRPNAGAIVGCVFNSNVPSTSATVYTGTGYNINFVRPDAISVANENSAGFGGGMQWNIAGNIFTGMTTGVMLLRGTNFNVGGNVIAGSATVSAATSITHYGDAAGTEKDADLLMGDATGRARLSQGVKFPGVYTINTVKLWLKKIGAPTDNLFVDLYSNSAGLPVTLISSSDAVVGSTLAAGYGYITFAVTQQMKTAPHVVAGGFCEKEETQWHLVLRRSGAADAANYYAWGADQSSPAYPDGRDAVFNSVGSTWSNPATAADMLFDCQSTLAQTAIRFRTPSSVYRILTSNVTGNVISDMRVFGWTDLRIASALTALTNVLYTGNVLVGNTVTTMTLYVANDHMVAVNNMRCGVGGNIHIDFQANGQFKSSYLCNNERGSPVLDNIGTSGIVSIGNTNTGLYSDLLPAIDNSINLGGTSNTFVAVYAHHAYGIVTSVEVDFGSIPVRYATFTITDAAVEVAFGNTVMAVQSGEAATGRQADENEMDPIMFSATAGSGLFTLYAASQDGPVAGRYKVLYLVS